MTDVPRPADDASASSQEPDREALIFAAAKALDQEQGHRYGDDWPEEYRQEAEAVVNAVLALLPTPPAPGGGGTDLRAWAVAELAQTPDEHATEYGKGYNAGIRAALAARDADQGAESTTAELQGSGETSHLVAGFAPPTGHTHSTTRARCHPGCPLHRVTISTAAGPRLAEEGRLVHPDGSVCDSVHPYTCPEAHYLDGIALADPAADDDACPNYPATCRGCVDCRAEVEHDGPCFCDCPGDGPHTLLFDANETGGVCACGVRFGPLPDSRAVLAAHYAHTLDPS